MAEDIRMWEIIKGKEIKEIEKSQFKSEHKEGDLEDWLENDITLISEDLLIIGRQVETYKPNADIDLLCLDENGDVVVIELKRDKTYREVTAQTLDYASWVKELPPDEIRKIADEYLTKKRGMSLEEVFRNEFERELPDLKSEHRMLIVASELDNETERIIKYLSEEYDVPINFVKFQYFSNEENKQEFLARVFLLDPDEIEERAKGRSKRKQVELTNPIELFDKSIIQEGDVFFFRDNEGKIFKDFKCYILRRKGRANAFYIKIEQIPKYDKINIPTYTRDGFTYTPKEFPIEETTKKCSIALHKLLTYRDEEIAVKEYGRFGNANFVREKDNKSLVEISQLNSM